MAEHESETDEDAHGLPITRIDSVDNDSADEGFVSDEENFDCNDSVEYEDTDVGFISDDESLDGLDYDDAHKAFDPEKSTKF